jgi:hypothetical protein|tara:strand:+ start:8410 stop:8595 length:186 start_codon:yes stop_codon:yes gene_type:complete
VALDKFQTQELYKAIEAVALAHKALDEVKAEHKQLKLELEEAELDKQHDMLQRLNDEEAQL